MPRFFAIKSSFNISRRRGLDTMERQGRSYHTVDMRETVWYERIDVWVAEICSIMLRCPSIHGRNRSIDNVALGDKTALTGGSIYSLPSILIDRDKCLIYVCPSIHPTLHFPSVLTPAQTGPSKASPPCNCKRHDQRSSTQASAEFVDAQTVTPRWSTPYTPSTFNVNSKNP
ncbi:hypothetical protein AB1N83_011762 [Pleurotus pulmonarius]